MNFQELESYLTCPICFDFFSVCMITSCSHNYCSLCIRKYLTYKSQCPTCFEETSEPELRNNRHIDDIVKFYLNKRQNKNPDNPSGVGSPSSISKNESSATINTGSTDLQLLPAEDDTSQKAPCPVCALMVKVTSINVHLDMCLNRDERKDSLRRSSLSNKRKKLPKVIYHFLSDKDLKKIVAESGLNSEGDRQALIKRHRSYLVLYNSECDSLNPRSVSEIVTQVHDEEKTETKLAKKTGEGLELDKKMNPDLIETKQKAYMKQHQSQFTQLVDDIQKRHLSRRNSEIKETVSKSVSQNAASGDKPSTSKCENNHSEELILSASDSEPESETLKRVHPASVSKTNRTSVDISEAEDEVTPVKRTRHPSDEF